MGLAPAVRAVLLGTCPLTCGVCTHSRQSVPELNCGTPRWCQRVAVERREWARVSGGGGECGPQGLPARAWGSRAWGEAGASGAPGQADRANLDPRPQARARAGAGALLSRNQTGGVFVRQVLSLHTWCMCGGHMPRSPVQSACIQQNALLHPRVSGRSWCFSNCGS